ncbi:MAG: DUF1289 domain-containing protein [Gammaproteobacteria bacterium]|jgi:hypothetical protein|nr:DUF1289 domain-containing protein [Gammaproteobacteria bacterium]MDP6098418.1 DUF1289 domain-containing protein [Gammaproteobacteria bacterium]MDP7456071.1 DUF1289 domain-containing protein [Gammaproteobacteria bacterium]|tara:strand:+ start:133 stop:585 length:453 start_codon:yes stop_codon:yes gene_type:complete
MNEIKTPCIGICSTTSLGDAVCRGCKRYADEVINWNNYDVQAKKAVLNRVEKLSSQIIETKLQIFSLPKLQAGLERWSVPWDPSLSPYCWVHNLLKKCHQKMDRSEDYGLVILPKFASHSLTELSVLIEEEILQLCEAHHDRYMQTRHVS